MQGKPMTPEQMEPIAFALQAKDARLATYEAALSECAALASQNPTYRPDIQFREIENIARNALESK